MTREESERQLARLQLDLRAYQDRISDLELALIGVKASRAACVERRDLMIRSFEEYSKSNGGSE